MNTRGSRYMTVSFAERRRQIEKQNLLARAVRLIHANPVAPVATLRVLPENPSRPCPDCGGNGYKFQPPDQPDGWHGDPCPRCDGSGQIGVSR